MPQVLSRRVLTQALNSKMRNITANNDKESVVSPPWQHLELFVGDTWLNLRFVHRQKENSGEFHRLYKKFLKSQICPDPIIPAELLRPCHVLAC